jgi:hypothetical protein
MVKASLEALPGHLQGQRTGQPYTDTPETQELWKQLNSRFPKHWYFEQFSEAFGILVAASSEEYQDILGEVYQTFANPNPGAGQFFTPWNIAKCMAEMSMLDIEKELHERVKTAIHNNPLAQAQLIAGVLIDSPEEAAKYFYNTILPTVAAEVDPITVCDPCCGSGVMLLAAASQIPRWALDWGLVQFYGADIDWTCVMMAQINCMLYGLNGYHLKCALDMSPAELAVLPEPQASAYAEAQQAQAEGDTEKVQQIAFELRKGQYSFANLVVTEPSPDVR